MSRRRTLPSLGDLRAELEALIAEAQARPVTVTGCSEPAARRRNGREALGRLIARKGPPRCLPTMERSP